MKWINSKTLFGLPLLLAAAVSQISSSFALSVVLPPEHLTHEADLVIVGRVTETTAEKMNFTLEFETERGIRLETSEMIVTSFFIDIERTLKGQFPKPKTTIFNMGGTLPDGTSEIDQTVFDLKKGTCIVAFLSYDKPNDKWMFYAGSRGVFQFGVCSDADLRNELYDPPVTRPYTGHYVPNYNAPPHYRKSDEGLTFRTLIDIICQESKE